MGQYSLLCGGALGLILGGFDIVEVDVQDREQVDSEKKVEARERERGRRQHENRQRTLKHVTSWMTYRWSECARCDTLSHNVMCAQGQSVREKVLCEVYLSTKCKAHAACCGHRLALAEDLHDVNVVHQVVGYSSSC